MFTKSRLPSPHRVPGGHDILEITSSGAGVGKFVAVGPQKHNFGLIKIDSGNLVLSTFKENPVVPDGSATIALSTW